ncbi:DNA/RNA nuclease SfsA [Candidatus Odyssella thessalonicensis]|uniref:DNA/RNA nuclease SfsA n=1 Tax=Candidatus Odyssella thessalonicensis TaxID=84647 RepID=UPI000225BB08|nr:DNA/RNA nuclease SfsA [Candidatus Odyssella thessalonicensis]
MKFAHPLVTGKLIKRYKRFLTDVLLDSGEEVTAHCTSTGALLGLLTADAPVWLSPATNPERKLKYTWEMVESEGVKVGVNTSHPNNLVAEAIKDDIIPELKGYNKMRREVKYGQNSRIDLLLEEGSQPPCYVEVKNVHLRRQGQAEFPDAVTERGAKHLREMAELVQQGLRAAMVYVVQRDDCDVFDFARDIDPVYAQTAASAFAAGVEAYVYACDMQEQGIRLYRPLHIK